MYLVWYNIAGANMCSTLHIGIEVTMTLSITAVRRAALFSALAFLNSAPPTSKLRG